MVTGNDLIFEIINTVHEDESLLLADSALHPGNKAGIIRQKKFINLVTFPVQRRYQVKVDGKI